jgi:3-carboxy-cis,cis-muconate cycloisomerase
MALAPQLGRHRAHHLVSELSKQAIATGRPLADLLAENAEIARHLDRAGIARLTDPATYLGGAGEMIDRVIALYETVTR